MHLNAADLNAVLEFVEAMDAVVASTGIWFDRTPVFIEGEVAGYIECENGCVIFYQES